MYAIQIWNHELGHVAIIDNLTKSEVDTDQKVYKLIDSLGESEDLFVEEVEKGTDEPVRGILVHYRFDTNGTLFAVRIVPWPKE